ncbi:MAG TPA: Stk1 family PASTA domain-containing Ser/Thr kinase [Limnochordia bacterium]|nr:Stk1 family PASTA domain-containing Ser/Thr kinase [Limnochordia bacterium]
MIGKLLDQRYEVCRKIGDGGMAVVYCALDRLLDRFVAIKVLREQYAGDTEFVERFRREAQAAASLSHPNVVNIYDVGNDGGVHYIVMEFVEGRNLKQILRTNGPLPVGVAVRVASEVAHALTAAHRQGLIHRDIKPHNILIAADGIVKVTDFGIARAASASTLTETGTVIGSVHYFSPEQARGSLVDGASDIYSLGVLLFEMVTGQLPYSGESPVVVALKHLQEDAPRARQLNGSVPQALDAIIRKAMQKEPLLRYRSADEMARELLRLPQADPEALAQLGSSAAETTPPDEKTIRLHTLEQESAGAAAAGEDEPEKAADDETKVARPGRPWRMVGLLALLLCGGGLFAFEELPALIFPPDVTVPDVTGEPFAQAQSELTSHHLRTSAEPDAYVFSSTVPPQHVVGQDPPGGEIVKEGRTILLRVSKGPEIVQVPAVVGSSLREAKLKITQSGLVADVQYQLSDATPDTVLQQTPPPGENADEGASVTITVAQSSLSHVQVEVPNFLNRALSEVEKMLPVLGLRLGHAYPKPSDQPSGTILDQNPPPGDQIESGGAVDFLYSSGEAPQGGSTDAGDGAGTTDTGSAAWHTARVNVSVPPGERQEVVIVVVDDFGARQVYDNQVNGGATISEIVHGRGDPKQIRIQVYIGGVMIQDEPFPA